MHISAIYAALAALLVVALSVRVIMRRQKARIGIGDGGDHELVKRVRAHANAVENLPISLILLMLVEWNQTVPWLVHVFGIVLILGRLLHAFGLSKSSGASPGRIVGMLLTFLAMLGMALLLLWQYLVVTVI